MYEFPIWNEKKVLPITDIISGYYLRFPVLDIPGVMGKIATILGENKINIESAHASAMERIRGEKKSYVHIFTELALEKNILQSMKKISQFKVNRGEATTFRILGDVNYGDRIS